MLTYLLKSISNERSSGNLLRIIDKLSFDHQFAHLEIFRMIFSVVVYFKDYVS